jgi:hypothetical protein
VRSILHTPSRKYSDDPVQIAAGTHMSPPPALNLHKALPAMPATAPVKKHVLFSHSTLQRASENELGKSPSPMKFRAGSEIPTGAVIYPTLSAVEYPEIAKETESTSASPSRRLTFGGPAANHPNSFFFVSGPAKDFGEYCSAMRPTRIMTDSFYRSCLYWYHSHDPQERCIVSCRGEEAQA